MTLTHERFLVAIDPSLTASGWAVFSMSHGKPCAVGLIEPLSARYPLADRMSNLQRTIDATFRALALGRGDILVCEGPAPLVINPQSALKVEGVRGIFETIARAHGMVVPGRVNPRTVQTELLGMRGKQLERSMVKEWARGTANQLYGDQLLELYLKGTSRRNDSQARDDNSECEDRASSCSANGMSAARKRNAKRLPQDVVDAVLIGTLALSRIRLAESSGMTAEAAFLSQARGKAYVGGSRRSTGWSEKDFAATVGTSKSSKRR